VIGLRGAGLVLNGDNLEAVAVNPGTNGATVSFNFQTAVPSGFPYTVTVQTQPSNPTQKCVVMAGSGHVGNQNVHSIVVNCSTDTFVVSGTVTGLQGNLILTDNTVDPITLDMNGMFAFPKAIPSGGTYSVAVAGNPQFPSQSCSVMQGSGTVTTANIINVEVTCNTNEFNVGGMVSSLTGTGLVLEDNGSDDLAINANATTFTFAQQVNSGGMFTVTIKAQPTGQICTLSGATGQIASSDVSSVVVNCSSNTYTVGGNVTGLMGSGLTLSNAGNTINVGADGGFAFPPQPDGSMYDVAIVSQPSGPSQTCVIGGATGMVSGANVVGVQVTCSTASFTVGGSVNGLLQGSVVLEDNGGDQITVSGNTDFTFPTALASGSSYNVTATPSSSQEQCTVSMGSGIIGTANVIGVQVSCSPLYTITVSINFDLTNSEGMPDLGGDTLTLGDGTDTIPLNGVGTTNVTFPTALPAGNYTVTSALPGSCTSINCGFVSCGTGDAGGPVVTYNPTKAIRVFGLTLPPTTWPVTLGPNATVCLQCTGDVTCCDDQCADGCANTCNASLCPQNFGPPTCFCGGECG